MNCLYFDISLQWSRFRLIIHCLFYTLFYFRLFCPLPGDIYLSTDVKVGHMFYIRGTFYVILDVVNIFACFYLPAMKFILF